MPNISLLELDEITDSAAWNHIGPGGRWVERGGPDRPMS